MATAAAVRKQPKHYARPLANGVEIYGSSTWVEGTGWVTSLSAVKGSRVVGIYDTGTWTIKVEGRVLRPQEGITEYDGWLDALREIP